MVLAFPLWLHKMSEEAPMIPFTFKLETRGRVLCSIHKGRNAFSQPLQMNSVTGTAGSAGIEELHILTFLNQV